MFIEISVRVAETEYGSDKAIRYTTIEVETEDRIGLLYTIADTLTDLEVDISTARILTEKGAAIDSFYVREMDGGKILSLERQKAIQRRLLHAINRLGPRD